MKIPKRNVAAIQPSDADAILRKLYGGLSRDELERAAIDASKRISELENRDDAKAGANENESPQRILTLRSPDELLGMVFDNSDIILGDRLLAKGQPLVIAGQGGTGKSRLILQIIAAVVSGQPCFEFYTCGSDLRWLILQTENSNRRLQQDIGKIKTWLGDDWPRFAEQVVIHTLENDDDGFVSLDSPDNQEAIQNAIETAKPNCIVIDPLNDFAAGDLNKDADMKATVQMLARLCRRGNPHRAIVVLHHSLTGKTGAARAVGFDRTSFSRNSKALFAWTRGQINLAPVEPDSNDRLIVACGKCSNGKEFSPFGVCLNPETMIYEIDPDFDLESWQTEMAGKTKSDAPDLSPKMVAGIVAELCEAGSAPKKPQLVKALRAETGCATSGAYKAIERAENAKKIHLNKKTKTYVTI
jgi:KaiC/GvpD/RAD55 family RecA-like ATPase